MESPLYTAAATTTTNVPNDNSGVGSVASRRRSSTAARHGRSGGVEFQIPPIQQPTQQTMTTPPPPLSVPTKNRHNNNTTNTRVGVTNPTTHRGGKATTYKRVKDCNCSSCILRNNNDSGIAKWEKSDAKDYLKSALDDASHPYWYDPPSKVYDDGSDHFHLYKYENFRNNLRSLKNGISSEKESIDFDEAAIERESIAFPRGQTTSHGNPFYDTSETKKILVELAKEGKLEQYKHHPKQLKQSNPIFKEFKDTVFAKAVNREKRRVKETVGWQMKRNIDGSKRHNAKYDKVQAVGE